MTATDIDRTAASKRSAQLAHVLSTDRGEYVSIFCNYSTAMVELADVGWAS